MRIWQLALLIIVFAAAAFLAAGQAITFAWLSAFPEQAPHLRSLEIKFWSYAALSAILVIIDIVLAVIVVRRLNNSSGQGK